ncbi:unnamed protein product [Peniophora sp. CBMAI 1063]|nr:unnamed protein product [Peniophora sp. CBMAI 1063]
MSPYCIIDIGAKYLLEVPTGNSSISQLNWHPKSAIVRHPHGNDAPLCMFVAPTHTSLDRANLTTLPSFALLHSQRATATRVAAQSMTSKTRLARFSYPAVFQLCVRHRMQREPSHVRRIRAAQRRHSLGEHQ